MNILNCQDTHDDEESNGVKLEASQGSIKRKIHSLSSETDGVPCLGLDEDLASPSRVHPDTGTADVCLNICFRYLLIIVVKVSPIVIAVVDS